ncbi:universal stress protein [Streptomyces sp. NPDC055099]
MLQPIVVGLDGSRESVAAANWAAREALRRELPLRLVHAWEGLPDADEPAGLPELRVPQYWARRILRTTQDRLAARYPQISISGEQIRRPPVPALVAEAECAELLVLGNQGFGGLGGRLAGSVAMAAVAQIARPVVLVRGDFSASDECRPDACGNPSERTAYRDVVLGLDVRHDCGQLLEFALAAACFRGAALRVIHAVRLPNARGGTEPARSRRLQGEAAWVLASVLDPWREKFPTVDVRAQVLYGRPTQEVVQAARDAGLLILGRQVRPGMAGNHAGRITHTAIHHVSCPVAVIAHDGPEVHSSEART